MLTLGLTHISKMTVDDTHTAKTVGSGDMEVLSTPIMIALMENAAMLAVAPELPDGYPTVGGHIDVSHIRPTHPGASIEAQATLTGIDGKKLYFDLQARQDETIIGHGKHIRFIVHKEKFARS